MALRNAQGSRGEGVRRGSAGQWAGGAPLGISRCLGIPELPWACQSVSGGLWELLGVSGSDLGALAHAKAESNSAAVKCVTP